ncbi:MAG: ATP-binding protein [Usitatibacter sp.]
MPSFITQHLDEIVGEWEAFARTMTPAAATMDSPALRDHAKQMLEAIVADIGTAQSDSEQALKSKGLGPTRAFETAAAAHGVLRQHVGFDLGQLVAEFRALRASVLRIWVRKEKYTDPESAYELARFNEAIDQALAESVETYSEELTKSRDTFLGILGHDLRSPLSAISGALHILAKSTDEGVRTKMLATGTRSVAAMSAMIRDLLEYTRSRLGKGIPVVPAAQNLELVCKVAINEVSLAYPQTSFRFEASGPLDGTFDLERIHQVISNLLNNAVQHGRPNIPVSLIAEGSDDILAFRVNNDGSPISPGHLESIFDPLVQIPTQGEEAHRTTNLGLGLFIAREIVLAHGGTIEATSSAQDGTTFSVVLPRNAADRAHTLAARKAA